MVLPLGDSAPAHRAGEIRIREAHGDPVAVGVVQAGPVARVLFAGSAALFLAGVLSRCSVYLWGHDHVLGLVPLFELDSEGNVPTWFQSSVLLLDALLAGWLALGLRAEGAPSRRTDLLAAGLLLYLSMDEAAQIHERLDFRLGDGLVAQRAYYYTWLVPGVALLGLAAWAMRAFLRRVPDAAARRARFGCAIYLAGAIGMELVGGLFAVRFGPHNFAYSLITCVEEGLEMAGMSLFASAMLIGLERPVTDDRFVEPRAA